MKSRKVVMSAREVAEASKYREKMLLSKGGEFFEVLRIRSNGFMVRNLDSRAKSFLVFRTIDADYRIDLTEDGPMETVRRMRAQARLRYQYPNTSEVMEVTTRQERTAAPGDVVTTPEVNVTPVVVVPGTALESG